MIRRIARREFARASDCKCASPAKWCSGAFRRRAALTDRRRSFTSNNRARPGMPYAFSAGETARQIVFSVRDSSATTRYASSESARHAFHRSVKRFQIDREIRFFAHTAAPFHIYYTRNSDNKEANIIWNFDERENQAFSARSSASDKSSRSASASTGYGCFFARDSN